MQGKRAQSTKETNQTKRQKVAEITVAEAKLYDRQIRLWGMQAQGRIRNSRILVCGMTGLTNEVLKNIVLAGVGSVTLVDDALVTERDLGAQFLLAETDMGTPKTASVAKRLRILNPMVSITSLVASIDSLSPGFYNDFDLVCVAHGTPVQIVPTK